MDEMMLRDTQRRWGERARERESGVVGEQALCQVSSTQLPPNSTLQLPLTTIPSDAVVAACFNWLIFWHRNGQSGEAGSISHAHQRPQEAPGTRSRMPLCVSVFCY